MNQYYHADCYEKMKKKEKWNKIKKILLVAFALSIIIIPLLIFMGWLQTLIIFVVAVLLGILKTYLDQKIYYK